MLPVLVGGTVLATRVGSVWRMVLLIVTTLMIVPLAFRRGLDWRAKLRFQKARPYYDQGDSYLTKAEYDLAIAEYSTAISIDRENPVAYTARCRAYFLKREYDLAIADCDTAIDIAPKPRGIAYRSVREPDHDLAAAYPDRGDCYLATGEYDLAIADFSAAISLNSPSEYFTYFGRGRSYFATGEYDLAIADFSAAIRLAPRGEYDSFLWFRLLLEYGLSRRRHVIP